MQATLLEHNVRFGDPECQCLMMRLESDLLEAMLHASSHQLHKIGLHWSKKAALTVVLAAKGYPGDYTKGTVIEGVDSIHDAKVRPCFLSCAWVVNLSKPTASSLLGPSFVSSQHTLQVISMACEHKQSSPALREAVRHCAGIPCWHQTWHQRPAAG